MSGAPLHQDIGTGNKLVNLTFSVVDQHMGFGGYLAFETALYKELALDRPPQFGGQLSANQIKSLFDNDTCNPPRPRYQTLVDLCGDHPLARKLTSLCQSALLSATFNSTREQSLAETLIFKERARKFLQYQKKHFPLESITRKEHLLGNHYWEFMRGFGSVGRYGEQALERTH